MNKKLAIASFIVLVACTVLGVFFITQIFNHFDDVINHGMTLLRDAMKIIVVLASVCFGAAGFFASVFVSALAKK
ncbi:MAG: hypothetical protein Q6373_006485 [Candidatus Sigynarchaeota archaeon]